MQTPARPLHVAAASSAAATRCCPLQSRHTVHVGLASLQNYEVPPHFSVICLSPQTEEGCFHSSSSIAVVAIDFGCSLGAGPWARVFVCFSSGFSRSHKRFYPNLPAFPSQMGKTIVFIPWYFCSCPLRSGAEGSLPVQGMQAVAHGNPQPICKGPAFLGSN